jgi:hypothetical protein
MQQKIVFLIPESARVAKEELIQALGTENNPSQWMIFMETVTKHLPEILSTGRPTKEAIDKSIIGQLGFSSWSEFVESENGLNWNYSGWKSFRRSWSIVEKHQWLKNEKMTCSEVNNLYLKYKDQFPKSKAEYDELLKNEKTNKAEKASKTIADLEAQIVKLNNGLSMELGKNQALSFQLGEAQKTILQLQDQANELRHQLKTAQKPAPKPAKAPELTRFQHFLMALGIQVQTKAK